MSWTVAFSESISLILACKSGVRFRCQCRHVIGPTGTVRVMMATKPVDFRKGPRTGGTGALDDEVRSVLRRHLCVPDETGRPCEADLLGRHGSVPVRQKAKFRWPNVQDGVMRLSAAEFSALLEGLDLRRVHVARETPAPVQPG